MQALPTPNPSVLFQPVSEGAILLNPAQEIYFGLNTVGAQIWQMLPASADIEALCDALAAKYPDVERSILMADVLELLDALLSEGLLIAPTVDAA